MSIETQISELTEAVRALTVVMQSGGAAAAAASTPAATAAATEPTKATKAEKPAKAEKKDEPKKEEPKKDAPADDFEAMKALVHKLVNDNSRGNGSGKAAATEIFREYGVKNIQSLHAVGKHDEIMGKLNAALAPAAAEEAEDFGL